MNGGKKTKTKKLMKRQESRDRTLPWLRKKTLETGSFGSSRTRERLRRCRVLDHLGAASKQPRSEAQRRVGVVSLSTSLQP